MHLPASRGSLKMNRLLKNTGGDEICRYFSPHGYYTQMHIISYHGYMSSYIHPLLCYIEQFICGKVSWRSAASHGGKKILIVPSSCPVLPFLIYIILYLLFSLKTEQWGWFSIGKRAVHLVREVAHSPRAKYVYILLTYLHLHLLTFY